MKENYTNLIIAILRQAYTDYSNDNYRYDVERFLKSDYCYSLTGIDGNIILNAFINRKRSRKNGI